MPPRLDMTPYWLIVPVIVIGVASVIAAVVFIMLASGRRREDER